LIPVNGFYKINIAFMSTITRTTAGQVLYVDGSMEISLPPGARIEPSADNLYINIIPSIGDDFSIVASELTLINGAPPPSGAKLISNKLRDEVFFLTSGKAAGPNKFYYFEDFINNSPMGQLSTAPAGTLSSFTMNGAESNRPGIGKHDTGTTATGRSVIYFNTLNTFLFGAGASWMMEGSIRINTLSTALERFGFIFGFADANSTMPQGDGAFFIYDEGGASGAGSAASPNFQVVTASAANKTYTTTSIPVVAGQWYKLKVVVNADASQVDFYIDGVKVVPTHSTNIPSGAGRQTSFLNLLLKSVGTTSRTADIDYVEIESGFLSR
jgi:hypothetical protein